MSIVNKFVTGRSVVAAAVVALLTAAKHFGLPVPEDAEVTVHRVLDALTILSTLFLTGAAHRADAPEDKDDDDGPPPRQRVYLPPPAPALLVALAVMAPQAGCAGARDFVDATAPIVDPLLRVIGYCRDHGAPEKRVAEVVEAYESGDRALAALRAAAILHELREGGVDVPRDTYADMVEAVAAVEGLQRGLRALDGRDADGRKIGGE